MTIIDSGKASSCIAVVEVRYPVSARPSIGGTHGAEHVATTQWSASITPMLSILNAGRLLVVVNRAVPETISQPYSAARSPSVYCQAVVEIMRLGGSP